MKRLHAPPQLLRRVCMSWMIQTYFVPASPLSSRSNDW